MCLFIPGGGYPKGYLLFLQEQTKGHHHHHPDSRLAHCGLDSWLARCGLHSTWQACCCLDSAQLACCRRIGGEKSVEGELRKCLDLRPGAPSCLALPGVDCGCCHPAATVTAASRSLRGSVGFFRSSCRLDCRRDDCTNSKHDRGKSGRFTYFGNTQEHETGSFLLLIGLLKN